MSKYNKATFGIFGTDITRHLPKELTNKTGRVFEIHVSDMVETHLCEITPSYCLEFLRLEPENHISDEVAEELNEISVDSNDITYYNVRDAIRHVHETETFNVTEDDTAEDLFERFRETHQCNHTFSAVPNDELAA